MNKARGMVGILKWLVHYSDQGIYATAKDFASQVNSGAVQAGPPIQDPATNPNSDDF